MAVGTRHTSAQTVPPRERVELILSQLDRLPTLPAVAVRLLAITTSEDSSARDVVGIITADAALTAALLRMVQRADRGVRAEGMTAVRAVTLLGFKTVRNLVLTVHVFELLGGVSSEAGRGSHRQALWMHNLAVACAAELLAEHVQWPVNKSDAFICGLLHDNGKIALDAAFPKSYARVIERVEGDRACICDAERALFGMDHTVAGKRLLARWGLPAATADCAWLHHQIPNELPPSLASVDMVRLVHAADALVRRHGIGFSGYRSDYDSLGPTDDLELGHEDQQTIVSHLPERMQPFLDALGFGDSEPILTVESLLRANQELGRINAEMAESHRGRELSAAILRAAGRFAEGRTAHETVSEVCVAAAACIRTLIGVDTALALVFDDLAGCAHVGCSRGGAATGTIDVLDSSEARDLRRAMGGTTMVHDSPMSASDEWETLWNRFGDGGDFDHLFLWPLMGPEGPIGAIVFSANESAIGPLRAGEAAALPMIFGLALAMALARSRSDRMAEELVELNRRLREARKNALQTKSLSMIAKMADGAAHELNNPLTVISGRAQLALTGATDAEIARSLEIIVEQARRASTIATDLMAFAKPPPPHPITQSLGAALQSMRQHWDERFGATADSIVISVTDPDLTVHADPVQLEEILIAVVTNALEACSVPTARVEVNSPSLPSDDTVRIVVRDNGVGMEREVLEHALDPFFSYRPAGRGRGLGLSRAYRLAEVNGGRLWLESTPNIGTTVFIELPSRADSK